MRVYLLVIFLFCGCATTVPQSNQQANVNTNSEALRFEQAKALAASDIPDLYNLSRLSKGSQVKIKHTRDNSSETYFTVKTVKDVTAGNGNSVYAIDSVTEGNTYTFSEDSASLRKVVSPYESIQPLTGLKDQPGSSLPQQIINVIGAGNLVIGIVAAPITHMQEKERNKEIGNQMRAMRIEKKVIGFKLVAEEELRVANKNILCKVYEVHTLTRQTMPQSKIMPASLFVMDGTERIWISEDVPFGIVKTESVQTINMPGVSSNPSQVTIPPLAQTVREINEVVEFTY